MEVPRSMVIGNHGVVAPEHVVVGDNQEQDKDFADLALIHKYVYLFIRV